MQWRLREVDMKTDYFVASIQDLERIYTFANDQLASQATDATAFIFESWTAPWRKESLDHYLKCGWSFIATSLSGEVSGFFLAQPLLFLSRQTQSLWVEMLIGENEEVTQFLTEIVIKTAREKHFQRVLFADFSQNRTPLEKFQVIQQKGDIGEWNYKK